MCHLTYRDHSPVYNLRLSCYLSWNPLTSHAFPHINFPLVLLSL